MKKTYLVDVSFADGSEVYTHFDNAKDAKEKAEKYIYCMLCSNDGIDIVGVNVEIES